MDNEVAKAKALKKTNALFVLACARGYIGDVKALIEQGANLDAQDKQKISGLHYACGQGRAEVVTFLWSKGVELDTEDPNGNLPLHYAVNYGKQQAVEVLLQKGAWTEGSNNADDTALHIAARKGSSEMVASLLNHGAKATLKDVNKRGLTAFGEAVLAGHLDVAKILHKAGARLQGSCRPWSLLHVCVSLGKQTASKYLLEIGADVNVASEDGETALHCAAHHGNTDLAKLLVKYGADISKLDSQGRVPQDLVKNRDSLFKLLQPRSATTVQPRRAEALKSELDRFKESSLEKQLEKVKSLTSIRDPAQLARQISEFPLEFGNQLQELTKLQQVINIQRVVVEILDDDDFQKQSKDPEAMKAVQEIQNDRQAMRRFAESKPEMVSFLHTLTRFQAVVRGNGDHPVPFQSLLRNAEEGYHDKSKLRLKGMELMLSRRKQAAIAAALAETEAAAKQAVEWEMDPKNDGRKSPALDTARSKHLPTNEIQPAETQSTSQQSRKLPTFASEPIELDDDGLPPLPPREPFTWQRLKVELVKAMQKTVLIGIGFVIFTYFMTRNLPWQDGGSKISASSDEPDHDL